MAERACLELCGVDTTAETKARSLCPRNQLTSIPVPAHEVALSNLVVTLSSSNFLCSGLMSAYIHREAH